MEVGYLIRKADLNEGPAITALALKSKAYWGYQQDFIEKCSPDLTVNQDYILRNNVHVAEVEKRLVGFYSIILEEDGYYLDNMFIDPDTIGKGLGRILWEHALNEFRRMDVAEFLLVSDPYAKGFYEKMGAVQLYEKNSSTFPGRKLPVMKVTIQKKTTINDFLGGIL